MAANTDQVPVVAVASGKGGVGKTTAAVNVALALSALGVRVGLVDADLYGPDAAHMMGLRRREDAAHVTLFAARGTGSSRLQAAERHGVQIASAALLIGEGQGLGFPAPLAELLVHRLISGTSWDEVDCLVVDLPPGTADIQQLVFGLGKRTTFALLVVTPQLVAHRDAHRLLHELERGTAVILGGIENMAGQICPSCGDVTRLFPGTRGRGNLDPYSRARQRAVQRRSCPGRRPWYAGHDHPGHPRASRRLPACSPEHQQCPEQRHRTPRHELGVDAVRCREVTCGAAEK